MNYTSKEVYEFISKETNDPIVEWKTCAVSGVDFAIYQSDLEFYKKVSPVFGGKKYLIPTPTLCPEERQRRRLLFRNERKLYKRKCDATGETIISIYSRDKPTTVYSLGAWWNRSSGSMMTSIDFEPSQTFTDQFETVATNAAYIAMLNDEGTGSTNCVYTNDLAECHNCYMVTGAIRNSDCSYVASVEDSTDCMDGYMLFGCNNCYELVDGKGSSRCFCSQQLTGCSDCRFSSHLMGCTDCIGCVGLVNAQYCIFNVQYAKEDFEREKASYIQGLVQNDEVYHDRLRSLTSKSAYANMHNPGSENVYGNRNYASSSSLFCFDNTDIENCTYVTGVGYMQDSSDVYVTNHAKLCYESLGPDLGQRHLSTLACRMGSTDIYYSSYCHACHHCFGCVGLYQKSYCIFNKQYTKREYEQLVPKIIEHMQETGEWGEFFDPSLSPFGYNETVAQEYFPLSREKAIARGYKRQDASYDPILPPGVQTLTGNEVSSDISTVSDDILKKIIVCEVSGRPFRIIKQELEFYRKYGLPLPRKHPDVRHQERLERRPGRTLYLRNCSKTGKEMLSVYPEDCGFDVYAEDVYQQEMYG